MRVHNAGERINYYMFLKKGSVRNFKDPYSFLMSSDKYASNDSTLIGLEQESNRFVIIEILLLVIV